jgi:histidine ammonia-lyase
MLDGTLTADDVYRIGVGEASIGFGDEVLAAVAANRAALERAIHQGAHVYGITTGLGGLHREQVPLDQARRAQVWLLRSHAAGTGPELPRDVVRAAVAIRANGLARAHSGVRPLVLETIGALVNAGFVPCVPSIGSLGASGDLAPSAHAFLPLIGEGEVVDRAGARMPAAEALSRLGIEPLVLEAKEGLALINGTNFMTAIGALLVVRVRALLDAADAAAAVSIDALSGSSPALDPRVHALRPLAGQATSAANLRAMVAGSERMQGGGGGRVQDAYSLRCVPQVHGAAREAMAFFTHLVSCDINAVTDNPLVFDDPPEVISAGNFHGQSLALAFDTLRIALADIASISERRIFRLVSPTLSEGLPAFLSLEPGPSSGYMIAQYAAAALVAELRALSHPVSVDSIPTSDNQEDHVSMGMTAGVMALNAVERVERVLAIEVLCGCQALDLSPGEPGEGVARVYRALRERVSTLVEDRPPSIDIALAESLVRSGALAATLAAVA